MKKNYSTPDIMFESFSLSTDIAGNCARPTNTPVQGKCALIYAGRPLFVSGVDQCIFPIEDGSAQFNGICYYVPTNSTNLFNS